MENGVNKVHEMETCERAYFIGPDHWCYKIWMFMSNLWL